MPAIKFFSVECIPPLYANLVYPNGIEIIHAIFFLSGGMIINKNSHFVGYIV